MKLVNQIMIAGTLSGVSEALAYACAQGIDPSSVISCLKDGAAGSRQLELLGPKMAAADYAPGFFIKHFIKDMRLAVEESKERDLKLRIRSPSLPTLRSWQTPGWKTAERSAL